MTDPRVLVLSLSGELNIKLDTSEFQPFIAGKVTQFLRHLVQTCQMWGRSLKLS